MAQIFKAPSEVKLPSYDWSNANNWEKDESEYKKALVKHINNMGYKGKNVGECIRIPHADSYAEYMVLSMKPLRLIHLELGDAWSSQFAELLTAKKVNQMIDADKAMAKLFSKSN